MNSMILGSPKVCLRNHTNPSQKHVLNYFSPLHNLFSNLFLILFSHLRLDFFKVRFVVRIYRQKFYALFNFYFKNTFLSYF
jgi:hypothetical protein